MKILIVAATQAEFQPAVDVLNVLPNITFSFLVTGVGMLATAVSLTKILLQQQPDLVIQVGIAGSFNASMPLSRVVVVNEEIIGDIGVEEMGVWKDIFDLNLVAMDSFPFTKKHLPNPYLTKFNMLQLDEVLGITVNEITTNHQRIKQLIKKYAPEIETMEGAALHYVCTDLSMPFIQIRSISNYIGERDKTKWQIKEAIFNLNQALIKFIEEMSNNQ
ncbi:MAG: futalosine hydrolase [Deinococcales bacterium]|nr:futalosine hydrolase [Chitinophagaceae bacterium]